MTSAAAAVAKRAGYTNAGTIEFLLDEDGSFYFLEMNTRLQVEHPITEQVSGVDLVQWQIRIARGERLTLDPAAMLVPRCHAVECRIYAEDPDTGFMPSPGRIHGLRVPQGPGIRDDSGLYEGGEVPIYYDPMISKLITWAEDRPEALARMKRALAEYEVRGIRTTIPFFRWILEDEDFRAGRFDTTFLDRKLAARNGQPLDPAGEDHAVLGAIAVAVRQLTAAAVSAADDARGRQPLAAVGPRRRVALGRTQTGEDLTRAVRTGDRRQGEDRARVHGATIGWTSRWTIACSRWITGRSAASRCRCWSAKATAPRGAWTSPWWRSPAARASTSRWTDRRCRPRWCRASAAAPVRPARQGSGPQHVIAPMPGKIVRLLVAPGDAVEPRQGLVVIEAMKMENELRASRAGRVKAIKVAEGQSVEAGALLVTVE